MLRTRILICVFLATAALAQSDIYARLRRDLPAHEGQLASEALAKKDFGQVQQLLARSKGTNDAERSELLALNGAVDFLAGKMGEAAVAFREASTLAPLKDNDRFTFAMVWVKLRDNARARALLSEMTKKYPERAVYLYWLGRLDYDQRRYQDAVEKLTRASELDPRSARVWDNLGLAFDMQGNREQALTAFDKAVTFNREQASASAWPPHDLGYLLLRMERLTEADAALRESLRYDSNLAQTHLYLGRVLEKEERIHEAIGEYLNAVSLDKSSPDACYSLAMVYRKLRRNSEAAAMFAEFRKRRQASQAVDATPQEAPSR